MKYIVQQFREEMDWALLLFTCRAITFGGGDIVTSTNYADTQSTQGPRTVSNDNNKKKEANEKY